MRTIILAGFALGLLTSVASAEPIKLTDQQLGTTTAGALDIGNITVGVDITNQIPTNVAAQIGIANALNLFSEGNATAVVPQVLGQVNLGGVIGGDS